MTAAHVREDKYQDDEVIMLGKTHKNRFVGYTVLIAAIAFCFVGLSVIIRVSLFPPPIGEYIRSEMLTPVVTPTGGSTQLLPGSVRIRTTVERAAFHRCRISKELAIKFSDGSYYDAPGWRRAYPNVDQTKPTIVIYSESVPLDAPPGLAHFWAKDTYNCGGGIQTMETPQL